MDVKDVKRSAQFVQDLKPPLLTGFQAAVEVAKDFAGCCRGFGPRGVAVRKLFAFPIQLLACVKNVEEIAGHVQLVDKVLLDLSWLSYLGRGDESHASMFKAVSASQASNNSASFSEPGGNEPARALASDALCLSRSPKGSVCFTRRRCIGDLKG
jgi:hypothetical protein